MRSRIVDRGVSLRIHGLSQKSSDFVSYMRQFSGKVTISLHAFENSLLGRQNSTPLLRIKNEMAVLSRDFESQIADLR